MSRMPQIRAGDLVGFLTAHGFVDDRQSGSHLTLKHEKGGLMLTILVHGGCDIGRGLVFCGANTVTYCGLSGRTGILPVIGLGRQDACPTKTVVVGRDSPCI